VGNDKQNKSLSRKGRRERNDMVHQTENNMQGHNLWSKKDDILRGGGGRRGGGDMEKAVGKTYDTLTTDSKIAGEGL